MVQTSTIIAATVGTIATGFIGKQPSKYTFEELLTLIDHSICCLLRSQAKDGSRFQKAIEEGIETTSTSCEGRSGSSYH